MAIQALVIDDARHPDLTVCVGPRESVGRHGRRRVARADETRGRRPDWRTSGQEPARILAVEIACPAWRVLCSAAWNRRPSVVVGNPARPTVRAVRRSSRVVVRSCSRARSIDACLSAAPSASDGAGSTRGHRRHAWPPSAFRQGLATGIGEEPVERAAEVPHVEPDRRRSAGTFPGVLGRHAGNQVLDVLAGPG